MNIKFHVRTRSFIRKSLGGFTCYVVDHFGNVVFSSEARTKRKALESTKGFRDKYTKQLKLMRVEFKKATGGKRLTGKLFIRPRKSLTETLLGYLQPAYGVC